MTKKVYGRVFIVKRLSLELKLIISNEDITTKK